MPIRLRSTCPGRARVRRNSGASSACTILACRCAARLAVRVRSAGREPGDEASPGEAGDRQTTVTPPPIGRVGREGTSSTDVPADQPQPTRAAPPTAARSSSASTRPAGRPSRVDETHFACPACGDLLDVVYDWDRLPVPRRLARLRGQVGRPPRPARTSRASGGSASCCRSPRPSMVVTIGEGQTLLQTADKVGQYVGIEPGRPAGSSTRG